MFKQEQGYLSPENSTGLFSPNGILLGKFKFRTLKVSTNLRSEPGACMMVKENLLFLKDLIEAFSLFSLSESFSRSVDLE